MQTLEQTDVLESAAEYAAMAQATLKLTAAEVADRVRPYVEKMVMPSFPDITFSVGEEGIRLSHGYWRVPVHPSRDSKRLSLVAETLGVLDDKLRECERILLALEIGDPLTCD